VAVEVLKGARCARKTGIHVAARENRPIARPRIAGTMALNILRTN